MSRSHWITSILSITTIIIGAVSANTEWIQSRQNFNYGIANSMRGNNSDAIENHNQSIQIDPTFSKAYYKRGQAYISLEEYRNAIESLSRAIDLEPRLAKAYTMRGLAYYYQKNYRESLENYNQALQIQPSLDDALYYRAIVYSKLNESEKSLADYNLALRTSFGEPLIEDEDLYLQRGIIRFLLLQPKDYKGAIKDFNQAIRISPALAAAYSLRGWAKNNIGDYKGAIKDFNWVLCEDVWSACPGLEVERDLQIETFKVSRVVEGSSAQKKGVSVGDHLLVINGTPATTIKKLRDITKLLRGPEDSQITLKLERKGQSEPIEVTITRTKVIDPNNSESYSNRGFAQSQLKEYDLALKDYDQAIKLDPVLFDAYRLRGQLKANRADYKGAIKDFDFLLCEDPDSACTGAAPAIDSQTNTVLVSQVHDDSPAQRSGIKKGDHILEINGTSTKEIKHVNDAVKLLRGKVGTPVRLKILREGYTAPLDIELIRAVVIAPTNAEIYAQRGDARYKIQNKSGALADWQLAANLFAKQGNYLRAKQIQDFINSLPK